MLLRIIVIASILCVVLESCGKGGTGPEDKTPAQLVSEGWQAFLARNYQPAVGLFGEAISKDANYVDAYNGAGWSNAKLNSLSAAINNFALGYARDPNNLEIKAGLSFVYNADKDYDQSIVLAKDVVQANPNWVFSRSPSIDVSDLRLLLAENYFAIAEFDSSYDQVYMLDSTFTADVSTIAGQTLLAQRIEKLERNG